MAGNSETLLNELNRQSPVEREKKLIEGAKKEGGVVIYSSEKRYPAPEIRSGVCQALSLS